MQLKVPLGWDLKSIRSALLAPLSLRSITPNVPGGCHFETWVNGNTPKNTNQAEKKPFVVWSFNVWIYYNGNFIS